MIDRRKIVQHWKQGNGRVLITLVRAGGSSYRQPGAHMLIDSGGHATGTISGGCLEAEVIRKASWKIRSGAVVETYSTLFDDTADIPYGLGCGGVVDLLFEPVDTPEAQALLTAMESSLDGIASQATTWLPGSGAPLRRAIDHPDGDRVFASPGLIGCSCDTPWGEGIDSACADAPYLEHLHPPQRLLVFGAGNDAVPVANAAAALGWSVTVIDGRPQLARPERFAQAERIIVATSLAGFDVRASDAAVLMTHSYEQDRAWLTALLGAPEVPNYIGLLGARHRSALVVSEAAAALGCAVEECCDRIWAPVGLDLGGDGPEAIALAIVAEVQASIHGRLPRSRRLNAKEVAEQISLGGASAYLRGQCVADFVGQ